MFDIENAKQDIQPPKYSHVIHMMNRNNRAGKGRQITEKMVQESDITDFSDLDTNGQI